MNATETCDLEKLAREIVLSRLRQIQDAPQAAAEIAKKMILAGVRSTNLRQAPRVTVIQVCGGVMGGLMFIEKNLPESAIRILESTSSVSHDLNLDPGEMMTWAMEGIASIMPIAGRAVRNDIKYAIDENFLGAGETFSRLCDALQARSPAEESRLK